MSVEAAPPPATAIADGPDIPLAPMPPHWRSLGRAFVHVVRAKPKAPAMADSTGARLTYGDAFLRALALGRALRRELGHDEPNLGLLLPPTVPAAVANLATTLLGKVAVNLNYTASQQVVDSAIDQAGLRHVVTSQKVLDKTKFQFLPEGTVLLLEELARKVTTADKVWAAVVARAVPIAAMGAFLPGLRGDSPEQTATIIFTSGSTGDPKGVVLSHRNILSNCHAINEQIHLLPDEVLLGILPFFHSMGYTVTVWTALSLGKRVAYHYDPLAARVIANLCETQGVTLIIGTPTFLRTYIQRCEPSKFATVTRVVLGAEKLKPELERSIRETLQTIPLEGYGCTELSPVVAVNTPHEKRTRDGRTVPGNRLGSVGMPLPGTAVKAVDHDTGADLPRGTEGLILVSGPQVMVGYLGRPEATAKVLKDGWYTTGDLGYVDDDGFLWITDRLSRFSKIGGEMVPHLRVEAAILEATGADESSLAVTALPDSKRGERLVVLYTDLKVPPAEAYRLLAAGPLPKLWLPSADHFLQVDALPMLGTGKLDLRRLRQIAEGRLGPA